MNAVLLVRALKTLFEKVLENADFSPTLNSGQDRVPKVLLGYVPSKEYEEEITFDNEQFPCVILRPTGGKTAKDDDGEEITVICIIGTVSEKPTDYELGLVILDRLICALEALPGGLIDNRYRYISTVWQLQEEQPYPSLWMTAAEFKFTTGLYNYTQDNTKFLSW